MLFPNQRLIEYIKSFQPLDWLSFLDGEQFIGMDRAAHLRLSLTGASSTSLSNAFSHSKSSDGVCEALWRIKISRTLIA